MDWISKLEKRFGSWAISNLGLYLIVGQIIVFGASHLKIFPLSTWYLDSQLVGEGQVHRLLTFIFFPPATSPLFLIFAWYIFFMISNALEAQWGAFKFNLYFFLGVVLTILVSLIIPGYPITNHFVGTTVFLAFATLYPNFEFLIFFVLPVKVKWLGWLSAALIAMAFFSGGYPMKLIIAAAMANYVLFFGKDFLSLLKQKKRKATHEKQATEFASKAFHTCTVCGATDQTHPERDFRYKGGKGYCEQCVEKDEVTD